MVPSRPPIERGSKAGHPPPAPESAEDRIADYTGWLAAFTPALAGVSSIQIYFLIRADKTARITAEAAKVSAEMVTNIERAFVFIEGSEITFGYKHPSVQITFRNYGRTPAKVARLSFFVRILDHSPTDKDIPPQGNPGAEAEVIIGAEKVWISPAVKCSDEVESALILQLMAGHSLYYWGLFEYRDIFGNIRPTYFCRRYSAFDGEFVPVGGFDRNKGG